VDVLRRIDAPIPDMIGLEFKMLATASGLFSH
jgi:hypothetical protein